MTRLIGLMLCICAALVGCGQKQTETAPTPTPAGEVDATDQLGPLTSPVSDIAFWTHPRLPFRGMVLAAAADGVTAFNIEDGSKVASIDGLDAKGLNVVYGGDGENALGVIIALERATGAIRFFSVDNASQRLAEMSVANMPGGSAAAFCAGPQHEGPQQIIALLGKTIKTETFIIKPNSIVFKSATTTRAPEETTACVVDPIDGSVFVATHSGKIFHLSGGKISAKPFVTLPFTNVAAIGLALNGLVEGGPTDQCCGELAVLNPDDASVHLFDRDDGTALGSVRIVSSYDVEGVATATAMGVGYGNFGAIYRDGVLALATDGDKPAVRLAPFNGVMDAIASPMGPTADPRSLSPHRKKDNNLVIDVDIVPNAPH